MINFRFHLVSLIAVFLALALGVVVGSTVIDRAIVDGLEAQIDRVERNVADQRRKNADLAQEFERVRVFAEQVAPFSIHEKLEEVPVALLATRGVNEDATRAIAESMRQAGALVPAVVWLEPSLALLDAQERGALRGLLGVTRGSADDLRRLAFEGLAARILAGSGAAAPSRPSSELESPPTGGEPADTLAGLVEAGFLSVDLAGGPDFDLSGFPGLGARVVLVSGAAGRVAADTVFVPVATALADASLLTLAVGLPGGDDAETDQAGVVGLVREDGALAARVSTVDTADVLLGRVAVVLALQELGRGSVGHYGLGAGASRRLPEPAGS